MQFQVRLEHRPQQQGERQGAAVIFPVVACSMLWKNGPSAVIQSVWSLICLQGTQVHAGSINAGQ
jgi:hypothetical protein